MGSTFLSLILASACLGTSATSSAEVTSRSLGTVEATERTFTVNLERLLEACAESAHEAGVFHCRVTEIARNGTEIRDDSRPYPEIFEDGVYFVVLIDGYWASVRARSLTEAKQKIRSFADKHRLLERRFSLVLHWAPGK